MYRRGKLTSIGDSIISYSVKGIRKLLELNGCRVLKIIPDYSKGKKMTLTKKCNYFLCYLITLLTAKRIILTPGVLIVSQPPHDLPE